MTLQDLALRPFLPLSSGPQLVCFGDTGRNILETSKGGSFLKPPPVPLPPHPTRVLGRSCTFHAAWHTWQTHRQIEAPWTPNARGEGQEGTGSHPRVGKGGTRAVSGGVGRDTPPISCPQPLLAATKGNVPNSQLPVTLLPKCKRQVKLLLPPPQSRQVRCPGG